LKDPRQTLSLPSGGFTEKFIIDFVLLGHLQKVSVHLTITV